MIAHLKGTLKSKTADHIVVDVNGVGYHVFISLNTFYELPPENGAVEFHVHTHVTQDQWSLYGFLTAAEKQLFQQLIKVSGIGPKSALSLLSGLSPHEIAQAIARGDVATLTKIPGIGRKTAERMIVDLKGKVLLGDVPLKGGTSPRATASQTYDEALSALLHLGYTRPQAEQSLSGLNWEKGLGFQEAIKQGLKNMAR